MEQGSDPTALWGINLYPQKYGSEGFIEFDSMINIRPRQKNISRWVEDPEIRKRIETLVLEKVRE